MNERIIKFENTVSGLKDKLDSKEHQISNLNEEVANLSNEL
jgi:hypothetical protein